jgi:hypothetical protein
MSVSSCRRHYGRRAGIRVELRAVHLPSRCHGLPGGSHIHFKFFSVHNHKNFKITTYKLKFTMSH